MLKKGDKFKMTCKRFDKIIYEVKEVDKANNSLTVIIHQPCLKDREYKLNLSLTNVAFVEGDYYKV